MVTLTTFNIMSCFGIIASLGWIMRQTLGGSGVTRFLFRTSIAIICVPYLFKILERTDGDAATWIDCSRDFGLLYLFVLVIVSHWKLSGRL